MSERITQELRRAMRIGYAVEDGEQVDAIRHGAFMDQCSAIDSIHANLERENDRLKCELDRVLGEMDEVHKTEGISNNSGGFMQNAEHHAWAPESHYMLLPKDADGEPVHVGDVMEWPTTGETFEVVGVGDGTLFYIEDGEERADWTGASTKRHHHADTWERIINDAVNVHGNGFNPCWTDERDALVTRCKALAGDAQ